MNSPFDVLTNLNANVISRCRFKIHDRVHYVEQRVGVPHRYFKLTMERLLKMEKIKLPIVSFVRHYNKKIVNDIEGNNKKFSKKHIEKTTFNNRKLYSIKTKNFLNF